MKDYIEESRKHFNGQAKEYDENTSAYFSGPAKISCEDIRSYLEKIEFSNLLDIGCGTGWLIQNLQKEHESKYYGIDISENMLEKAKEKKIPNSDFMLGKSDKLPYDDETFDIVTCVQSFHHYPDSDKAMKEAYRVLKKDGLYILSDSGVGGIGKWIDNNLLFKIMKSGDCRVDNREGIAKRMKSHHFDIVRNEKIKGMIYTVIGKKNIKSKV